MSDDRITIDPADRTPFLCALVGCQSPFARWFRWPYRLCSWRYGR